MKYKADNILLVSFIIIMTYTILTSLPAYSLTNNNTVIKPEISNNQNLIDSAEDPIQNSAISTSCTGTIDDIDGDMIPTEWEKNGIDINNDNIVDLDLKKLGAKYDHKDLFLEIDYMEFHKPVASVIDNVVLSFANSPVCNPDDTSGINLHIDLDEEITPHKDTLNMTNPEAETLEQYTHFTDFYKIKNSHFGNINEQSDPNSKNILEAKGKIYHYGLFIHANKDEPTLLGIAKNIPAIDFIVSLGASGPQNSNNHITGTASEQASTLMHEFGHTIGLGHGGSDFAINNKPNYIGVMNYLMTNAVVANSKLDYSRCALDSLDETGLNEPNGIRGITNNCPDGLNTAFFEKCSFHPKYGWYGIAPQMVTTGNAVDWGSPEQGIDNIKKQKNINCDGNRFTQVYTKEMKGFDDWTNIKYLPTNIITETSLGNSNGESAVRSNSVIQNLNSIQTNTTDNNNDDLILKTLKNEPTSVDKTFQTLGVLAGINTYVENNITKPSFQQPTNDEEGNPIPTDPFAAEEGDPVTSAKEYYNTILGDPISILDPSAPQSEFAAEEENKDTVANDILVGNIDRAIQKLDKLLLTSDSSRGGDSSNDRITNPVNQEELKEKINNLKGLLKTRSCTYDEC
jgi:hypothetical protein